MKKNWKLFPSLRKEQDVLRPVLLDPNRVNRLIQEANSKQEKSEMKHQSRRPKAQKKPSTVAFIVKVLMIPGIIVLQIAGYVFLLSVIEQQFKLFAMIVIFLISTIFPLILRSQVAWAWRSFRADLRRAGWIR